MGTRNRTLIAMSAAAVLLVLLAAGLHDVSLQPGRPLNLDFQWTPTSGSAARTRVDLPGWLPAVSAIGLVIAAIALIVSKSLRRDVMRNLPTYVLLLLGVFLLRNAAIGEPALRGPQSNIAEQAEPAPGNLPEVTNAMPDYIANPPEWLVTAMTLVLIAGVGAIAYQLYRRIRRSQPADPLDELVQEVREVLADLQAGADLRDTITRCYTEMVRVINAQRGVTREISMTPREFELRLAASGLAEAHIQRLTRLFERVRYGPHALGATEEQEAEACLRAIVDAYGT